MNPDRDRIYLQHILQCIEKIQEYTCDGKESFISNSLIQDAVLRRLQTMAESTQRLSDDLKANAPDVDWRALSGFRNILVHDYLNGVDLDRVWNAVTDYLPGLKSAVQQLSRSLD
ncbi:MAG: DUF86 domain-containing protein [Microcoleaceae cyanobacterium]